MSADDFLPGQIGQTSFTCKENAVDFQVRMALARVRTALDVQVVAVHAGSQPYQYQVDVQPLVKMMDGAGNTFPHGTIFGLNVANMGGANGAVCVKPKKGDLGFIMVADRDHSSARKAKDVSPPGSRRMHDLSDATYHGGHGDMNTAATSIVIDETGIKMVGNVAITGALTATNGITAGEGTSDQVSLLGHVHAGVQSGSSSTLAPTAGT